MAKRYDAVVIGGGHNGLITAAYLANAGTIRTGAGSTAVLITGRGAAELGGAQSLNPGTIQAGADASGTAISLNADNDLDSYIVNVGEIGGSIVFGGGNDTLVNTQLLDNTGLVTSTGNITLNSSVIDFGGGSNRFDLQFIKIRRNLEREGHVLPMLIRQPLLAIFKACEQGLQGIILL